MTEVRSRKLGGEPLHGAELGYAIKACFSPSEDALGNEKRL